MVMARTPGKRVISQQDNYVWLLLALLIFFFLGSLAAQLDLEILGRVMAMSLTGIVLVAVWSMEQGRYPFSSRVLLTLIFVGVEGGELLFGQFHLGTVQLVSLLVFSVVTIIMASRQVLLTGAVDSNKIVGAICIYLLMGIAWAEAYLLVERIFPGSIPALSGENWRHHTEDALYFSYVTLTTLGYGDISPVQPLARYLAYLQAVVGQFYIAIVVASLIGAKMSDDQREV
jgi:voltage-gated potassium channel